MLTLRIRECSSNLYLGITKEIYRTDVLPKEAIKSQTKHADRMTLPSSSQTCLRMYFRVRENREIQETSC